MAEIVIEHVTRHARRSVAFTVDVSKSALTLEGETATAPDFSVHSYDPERDIVYRTPHPLTPSELEEELAIHFPEQLVQHLGQRPLASTLQNQVLLQPVLSVATRISPLAALGALLERVSDVNTALLHCENGAMTMLRRAGTHVTVHFSSQSLETFVTLPEKSREDHFPAFGALEILLTGSDVMTSDEADRTTFDLETVRPIALADLRIGVTIAPSALSMVIHREPVYAMHIAAALMLLDVSSTSLT